MDQVQVSASGDAENMAHTMALEHQRQCLSELHRDSTLTPKERLWMYRPNGSRHDQISQEFSYSASRITTRQQDQSDSLP
jgi:hypothetical protein